MALNRGKNTGLKKGRAKKRKAEKKRRNFNRIKKGRGPKEKKQKGKMEQTGRRGAHDMGTMGSGKFNNNGQENFFSKSLKHQRGKLKVAL